MSRHRRILSSFNRIGVNDDTSDEDAAEMHSYGASATPYRNNKQRLITCRNPLYQSPDTSHKGPWRFLSEMLVPTHESTPTKSYVDETRRSEDTLAVPLNEKHVSGLERSMEPFVDDDAVTVTSSTTSKRFRRCYVVLDRMEESTWVDDSADDGAAVSPLRLPTIPTEMSNPVLESGLDAVAPDATFKVPMVPTEKTNSTSKIGPGSVATFKVPKVPAAAEETSSMPEHSSDETDENTKYLTNWIPVIKGNKLMVVGDLLNFQSLNLTETRWRSTRIVERKHSRLVRSKGTFYVLEGLLHAREARQWSVPEFIIRRFKVGIPANWQELILMWQTWEKSQNLLRSYSDDSSATSILTVQSGAVPPRSDSHCLPADEELVSSDDVSLSKKLVGLSARPTMTDDATRCLGDAPPQPTSKVNEGATKKDRLRRQKSMESIGDETEETTKSSEKENSEAQRSTQVLDKSKQRTGNEENKKIDKRSMTTAVKEQQQQRCTRSLRPRTVSRYNFDEKDPFSLKFLKRSRGGRVPDGKKSAETRKSQNLTRPNRKESRKNVGGSEKKVVEIRQMDEEDDPMLAESIIKNPKTLRDVRKNDEIIRRLNGSHEDNLFRGSRTTVVSKNKKKVVGVASARDIVQDLFDSDSENDFSLHSARTPIGNYLGNSNQSLSPIADQSAALPSPTGEPSVQAVAFLHRRAKEMKQLRKSKASNKVSTSGKELLNANGKKHGRGRQRSERDLKSLVRPISKYLQPAEEEEEDDDDDDVMDDYFNDCEEDGSSVAAPSLTGPSPAMLAMLKQYKTKTSLSKR